MSLVKPWSLKIHVAEKVKTLFRYVVIILEDQRRKTPYPVEIIIIVYTGGERKWKIPKWL